MPQHLDTETAQVLRDAQAFLFDVFGTAVDWEGSVARLLRVHYTGELERTRHRPARVRRTHSGQWTGSRSRASGARGSTSIRMWVAYARKLTEVCE